jgi:hypothetical protein
MAAICGEREAAWPRPAGGRRSGEVHRAEQLGLRRAVGPAVPASRQGAGPVARRAAGAARSKARRGPRPDEAELERAPEQRLRRGDVAPHDLPAMRQSARVAAPCRRPRRRPVEQAIGIGDRARCASATARSLASLTEGRHLHGLPAERGRNTVPPPRSPAPARTRRGSRGRPGARGRRRSPR